MAFLELYTRDFGTWFFLTVGLVVVLQGLRLIARELGAPRRERPARKQDFWMGCDDDFDVAETP